jgi:excisionase family DNA binding protein
MTDQLLTTADVAAKLQVSERTIRRLIASGQLRPVYVGRLPRFTDEELRAYTSASFRRAA